MVTVNGSTVRIELSFGRLPVHPYVFDMYRRGETTGSNRANRKMAEGLWEKKARLAREEEELLFDPQTSGGLLLSVPSGQAGDLVQRLKENGVQDAVVIGDRRAYRVHLDARAQPLMAQLEEAVARVRRALEGTAADARGRCRKVGQILVAQPQRRSGEILFESCQTGRAGYRHDPGPLRQ